VEKAPQAVGLDRGESAHLLNFAYRGGRGLANPASGVCPVRQAPSYPLSQMLKQIHDERKRRGVVELDSQRDRDRHQLLLGMGWPAVVP
jgi:hypothetical protein